MSAPHHDETEQGADPADVVLRQAELESKARTLELLEGFTYTPRDIKAYLDQTVMAQQRAKMVLSVGIAYHYRRTARFLRVELEAERRLEAQARDGDGRHGLSLPQTEALAAAYRSTAGAGTLAGDGGQPMDGYIKKNILLMGPTGCGKTYSVKKAAELVGVPFIKEDMTKFTAAGYVGRDVEEIAIDLLMHADGNLDAARVGIAYLDEIDKVAATPYTVGKDVNGAEVQHGLLKILEGSDIVINKGFGQRLLFDTTYVLFVASGAFSGLPGLAEGTITTEALIARGLEPEFVGRFPVQVVYEELKPNHLYDILATSKESPLLQYQEDLAEWDISLNFEDAVLLQIAQSAYERKLGARSLVGILEDALLDFMYALPGRYEGPLRFTRNHLSSPKQELKKLVGDGHGL